MDPWITAGADQISARAERELEALVAVSSPSSDVRGAEEAIAVVRAFLPEEAQSERIPCSTPAFAPDLLATVTGEGKGKLLLLGHIDTVVAHGGHRPMTFDGPRLGGSGTVDMKGGDVLALGVLRVLAQEPQLFHTAALLLVCDEEWRSEPFAHVERFADYDACLCFEAGERGSDGEEGVVVHRKAAGTVRVKATGVSAHSGAAPDRGANALLALARVAVGVAAHHSPDGDQRLTVVPTVMRSGGAVNVVPAEGELMCDLRADSLEAFDPVLADIPTEMDGVTLQAELMRRWPGMDTREATAPVLAAASQRLGRTIIGVGRGGASDASHLATAVGLTVDGLGPRGGGAHTPGEFVLRSSLGERAEVALAIVAEILAQGS